jgi:hypothetical protein
LIFDTNPKMVKKTPLLLMTATLVLALSFGLDALKPLIGNPIGAPAGRSGGPAENGATCAAGGCHGPASNTVVSTLISSSPSLVGGYLPGATYTITITVSGSGAKGFQFSAQSATGSTMGTLTAPASLQILQNRWITHRSPENSSLATWSFTWVAPSSGSGIVGFYACGISGRNSSLFRQTLSIPQSTVSVQEISNRADFRCWPQPAHQELNVQWNQQQPVQARWELRGLDGKSVGQWSMQGFETGTQSDRLDLGSLTPATGLYYLQLKSKNNDILLSRKVLIHP